MSWQSLLKNASIGILAMAAVHIVQRRARGGGQRDMVDEAADFLLGGALAAAYSRLIPWEDWGIESGVAFAQLPMVLSVAGLRPAERERAESDGVKTQMVVQAAELALWGAMTGLAMNWLGEAPGEEHARKHLLQMPGRR